MLADISQYDPRLAPRTPFAWFSPSCTHHTDAQGKSRREIDAQPDLFGEVVPDELAERSRATMWDVVRYSEFHRYPVVMVENVLEVTRWVLYRAWLLAMDALGYEHVTLSINSMHAQAFGAPAPQSRDRVYWLFWRKGNRAPDVERIQRPQAFCPACDRTVEARKSWKNGRSVGRYRQQYVFTCSTAGCGRLVEPWWVPAYTAIDWTNRGERIGDRKRGLSDSARGRIAAGIARHWHPIHLEVAGNTYDAASPKHPGYGNPNSFYRAWSVTEPMRTLHTTASKALAVPPQGLDGKGAEPWTDPTSRRTTSGTAHGRSGSASAATRSARRTRGTCSPSPSTHSADRPRREKGGDEGRVDGRAGGRTVRWHGASPRLTVRQRLTGLQPGHVRAGRGVPPQPRPPQLEGLLLAAAAVRARRHGHAAPPGRVAGGLGVDRRFR